MHRINFIHQPHSDGDPVRSLRAFVASCAVHGVLIALVVGLSFFYRSHLPQIKSGSAAGASVISLETMVITSPPSPPAPPTPTPLVPQPPATIPPALIRTAITPILPKLPDVGVPVLAAQPHGISPPKPTEAKALVHPAVLRATTTLSLSHPKPAAAAAVSSYARGVSDLPHPPYPMEARDRHETGVVVMNVQFDGNGDVARAVVAQSSGVPILDSETRSFIRAHWHSAAFAGQTISQPVEYSLENL